MVARRTGLTRALRFFEPLVGRKWVFAGSGPMGKHRCTREYRSILAGNYVEMTSTWDLTGESYEELAVFGVDRDDRKLKFWSFTSDGKRTVGTEVAVAEAPAGTLAFEADMHAGKGRTLPTVGAGGKTHDVAVEAKPNRAKGFKRFLDQAFRPASR